MYNVFLAVPANATLITPRVAASRQDAREITEELRSRVRSLAPLEFKIQ